MAWFKRHLNLTLLFAWLVANYLGYLSLTSMAWRGDLILGGTFLVLAGIVILGTGVWYLRQKSQGLFNILWSLTWIGGVLIFFSGLWLDNKFNTNPIFVIVGLLLGVITAIYGVYRILSLLSMRNTKTTPKTE